MTEVIIKETTKNDLSEVMKLWNDGDVMKYVGFPSGIGITLDKLMSWYSMIQENIDCRHFSIYEASIGYCGETYYEVDVAYDLCTLDIKLVKVSRGKGIAMTALAKVLDTVFENELCTSIR